MGWDDLYLFQAQMCARQIYNQPDLSKVLPCTAYGGETLASMNENSKFKNNFFVTFSLTIFSYSSKNNKIEREKEGGKNNISLYRT